MSALVTNYRQTPKVLAPSLSHTTDPVAAEDTDHQSPEQRSDHPVEPRPGIRQPLKAESWRVARLADQLNSSPKRTQSAVHQPPT